MLTFLREIMWWVFAVLALIGAAGFGASIVGLIHRQMWALILLAISASLLVVGISMLIRLHPQ